MWPKKYKNCLNCGTCRFEYKARGHCVRCYPYILKIEKISRWDLSDSKTLVGYPREYTLRNSKYFVRIKKSFLEQLNERLSEFKYKEKKLQSDVDGGDVVAIFQRISRLARSSNKDFLWHQEDLFDHNFNKKQKKILYKLLNDIEENIRWTGIDYQRIFEG